MANSRSDGQLEIKTQYSQFTKVFCVYDPVSFLLTEMYEAPTDAINGTPCTKTSYVYDGASSRILKLKEESASWDSSWDI